MTHNNDKAPLMCKILDRVVSFDSPVTKQLLELYLLLLSRQRIAMPEWETMTERFYTMLGHPYEAIDTIWTDSDEFAFRSLLEYYRSSCLSYFHSEKEEGPTKAKRPRQSQHGQLNN